MTPSRGFREPRILFFFLLVTLIWSSTWIVIKDQISGGEGPPVPAAWSVTYRYLIASAAMFVYAAAVSGSLRIGPRGHRIAMLFGIPQFCLNFNLVYGAEHYVTSGLVATFFALLMVPNSALAWLFLRHKITLRFAIGSAIACVGVALLFVQEMRTSPIPRGDIAAGLVLSLLAVLSASIANVIQASRQVTAWPIATLLAWGMAYGTLANLVFAWFIAGPPVAEARIGYWAGLIYLGLFASALAFPLYFAVIRAVGPGKAAYSSLLVPIIAMGISTLVEDYHWSPLAVAGGLIALGGMALALAGQKAASAGKGDEPVDLRPTGSLD